MVSKEKVSGNYEEDAEEEIELGGQNEKDKKVVVLFCSERMNELASNGLRTWEWLTLGDLPLLITNHSCRIYPGFVSFD